MLQSGRYGFQLFLDGFSTSSAGTGCFWSFSTSTVAGVHKTGRSSRTGRVVLEKSLLHRREGWTTPLVVHGGTL